MTKRFRHVGAIEAGDTNSSYTDTTGAYVDYDGSTYAQFGAKVTASGSLGVRIRTMLAGVVVNAITIAANGVATMLGVTLGTANYRVGTTTLAVSTTPTTIYTISSTSIQGVKLDVSGVDGAGRAFVDVVTASAGQGIAVAASSSCGGTGADTRTYTLVGNVNIQLAMSARSYTVKTAPKEFN